MQFMEKSFPLRTQIWRTLRSSPGDKLSFSQTSKTELKPYIKSIKRNPQALCIQNRNIADGVAFNEMTESLEVTFERVAPSTRQQNWNRSCEVLPALTEEPLHGTSPITTGNGFTYKNVPMSSVNLLSNGFFIPTGQYPECVIQAAL